MKKKMGSKLHTFTTEIITNLVIRFAYKLFRFEKKNIISISFAYPVMVLKLGAKGAIYVSNFWNWGKNYILCLVSGLHT